MGRKIDNARETAAITLFNAARAVAGDTGGRIAAEVTNKLRLGSVQSSSGTCGHCNAERINGICNCPLTPLA